MLVALDSNIFIAFFSKDDEFYQSALDIVNQIYDGQTKAVCSSIVFGEILYTATREESIRQVDQFFGQLQGCSVMPADKQVCMQAALLRLTHSSLKLPDAIHLATALVAKASLFITADKQLAAMASKEIKTKLIKRI